MLFPLSTKGISEDFGMIRMHFVFVNVVFTFEGFDTLTRMRYDMQAMSVEESLVFSRQAQSPSVAGRSRWEFLI